MITTEPILPAPLANNGRDDEGKVERGDDAFEIFKKEEGVIDFRMVGWIPASVIFLKSTLWLYYTAFSSRLTTLV